MFILDYYLCTSRLSYLTNTHATFVILAVDALMVIILALMNDISMIPVAYDNASATSKPQMPKARTLVYQSLFYGVCHAALTLMFIFTMDYAPNLNYQIDLDECNGETRGFIWMQLLFVTEMMIFSVRAPGFFIFSMPSIYLIISVGLTIVVGALIACLVNTFGLHGANLGYIALFNLGSFIIVDLLKIQFRKMIGEAPGDIITSDELIEPPARTETQKQVNKGMRQHAQRDAVLDIEDRDRVYEVRDRGGFGSFFGLGTDLNLNGGFINKNAGLRTSLGVRSMNVTGPSGRTKQVSSPLY